ncbi:hypothetical protein [Hymenobacter rigui]|uniref:STAS/SEC14 domain-containing protein n=1 Tax=Hymenobacter rigui TaxID=334424 RepID=A0A428KM88_9BACT|nr:hypothetical protein [Hymenobacter rigui]RSK47550.1 hypothetical protein EI291_14940 [Hymenobacter rigui]
MAELYFSNPIATVWLDPMHVRVEYKPGPRQFEEFTGLLQHLMRAFTHHRVCKAFIDQREMEPFTAQEQAYVLQQWLPVAIMQGGYCFGAVLSAKNVFARLATTIITNQVKGLPMTYQYFEDEALALAWLSQQQV